MAKALEPSFIPKNPPKPDYVWDIDDKRKMWVYQEPKGVVMVLVVGNRRYYQEQHYDMIINALFQRQLLLTIQRDHYKEEVKRLRNKKRE